MIRVLARKFYLFLRPFFILDLGKICNCCLIEQKTIQHCLNNNFLSEGNWGKCIGGKKQGIAGRDKNVITISCLRIFFFIDFHTHALQIFFSCLWQNVYTILFSFSERAWAQFYWLPRPREHNRVGSGLALRGVFHKMHFHQWELKCTSAIFTMFKPRTSFFFQLHCCTIVQQ